MMTRRSAVPVNKTPVTWILVADSRQAQIYVRHKVEKWIPFPHNRRNQFEEIIAHEPVAVPGMRWRAESIHEYDFGPDTTARVFESVGDARHMSEPHITVQEEIRQHLARSIAQSLYRAHMEKAFDRLVLIAPPKMLGEIKRQLDGKLVRMIVAEMPKDLTHYEGEELADHLNHIA
jgi:protein required for attachment to host cells